MNKKLLSSAIAAALGFSFASSSSMAVVDLDAGTGTAIFAQELDIDSFAGVLKTSAASLPGALNAQVTMGFGFSTSTGEAIYVRFDLDNSAKWAANLTSANLDIASAAISLSQGGTTIDPYVIFNVTPQTGSFSQTTAITLDLHDSIAVAPAVIGTNYSGIKVANKNPVNLKYRLYTSALAAAQGANETSVITPKSGELLKFQSGLTFSAVTDTATAEVTDKFLLFNSADTTGMADTTKKTTKIGLLTLGIASPAPLNKSIATAAPSDIVSTSTTLVVSGDFTSAVNPNTATAAGVYITTDTTCAYSTSAAVAGTLSTDEKTATFVVGTNQYSNNGLLCYKADGTTPILASEYMGTYKGISDVPVGIIRRNGVELQSPFVALAPGYVARFYVTNTSSKAVDFTVSAQTDPTSGAPCTMIAPFTDCAANSTVTWGGVAPAPVNTGCKIPANSSLLFKSDDVFAKDPVTGKFIGKRCTITVRAAADASVIHGLYQQRTTATTDFDSYLMISIGSNSAH